MFANALQALGGGNAPGPSTTNVQEAPPQTPEERFGEELRQLACMGFTNTQANIQGIVKFETFN
jgi:hypothetical protein